jgi:hypothetical protein
MRKDERIPNIDCPSILIVSILLQIFEVNLEALLPAGGNANAAVAILACSDGIWDNWKFEECAAFVVANGNEVREIEKKMRNML